MIPQKSKLIVLEGIDGSGKGTQNALLTQHFIARGIDPLHISFPDYESASSAAVRMYLDGKICDTPDGVGAYAASSFFAVDRYISFKMKWEAEYLAGRVILANRYTTSNITHQMEKLPASQWEAFVVWLSDFEYTRLGLPRPDLVIYLDMHESVSQTLLRHRYSGNNEQMDIHERDKAYLGYCRNAALYAAKALDWQVIRCFDPDSLQPLAVDVISRQIYALADALISRE